MVTAAASPELRRGDRPQRTEEKVNVQTELSRIITLVGEEAVSAQEAQIGYNLERYMVWKDLNGAIGVSNVEFPDRTDMYVAVRDRWYNVKRRQPEGVTEKAETQTAVVEKRKSTEEIAAGFSRNYLVWKSAGEVIGVGDTQYPERDRLEVASTGGWAVISEEPLAEKGRAASSAPQEVEKQLDEKLLAAGISNQYLMWKDKNGQIGFSNMEYPEFQNIAYVHTDGSWQKIVN